jgi:hypothetical protein
MTYKNWTKKIQKKLSRSIKSYDYETVIKKSHTKEKPRSGQTHFWILPEL